MKTTKTIIHVERPKAGGRTEPGSLHVGMYDTMMAIVTNANRVRSRVDGIASRLKYLEALLERQGGR